MPVKGWIPKNPVLEVVHSKRIRCTCRSTCEVCQAGAERGAPFKTEKDPSIAMVDDAIPNFINRCRFARSKTCGRISWCTCANQCLCTEVARTWILQDPIANSVKTIASGNCGLCRSVGFGGRDKPTSVYVLDDRRPHLCRFGTLPVYGGITRNNSIIFVRIALRLHVALIATTRAAIPVRIFLIHSIIPVDQFLGPNRLLMDAIKSKVAYQSPIQGAVGIERESTTGRLMARVRR